MTENNNNIWEYDNLSVNEDGEVVGSAYTFTFGDGYNVQIGVFSYVYERNEEFHTNHVPNVVVSDSTGSIVAEPHARDSENPETAIENAKSAAEYVYENPEEYVGD